MEIVKKNKCSKTISGLHYTKESNELYESFPNKRGAKKTSRWFSKCVACGLFFDK